jgi:hypothetical protein
MKPLATGEPQCELAGSTLEAAPPVLMTEKEVLFSTAAAIPLRPTTMGPALHAINVVLAAMHRVFTGSAVDGVGPHQHYPKRHEFLERACLAREMNRL